MPNNQQMNQQAQSQQTQLSQAKQQLAQMNQKFLQEIGTLATQLQQKSQNQDVKNLAGQIADYANQVQMAVQQENQL